jgi:hypothetical protein
MQERLPWQRKTQRENLALLIATMLSERSANLMSLAAALPRPSDGIDGPSTSRQGSPLALVSDEVAGQVKVGPLVHI